MSRLPEESALAIAAAVRQGNVTARAVVEAALARIAAGDGAVNAFSAVVAERALARADRIDGGDAAAAGPLAGVPFAVKNLYDLAGLTTLAGAKLTAGDPPASADADLVARLEGAGAICVGALHMGEFAYDFTGENAHYGPCRNPHDLDRMTGGSSSGSGTAVAAGLVPLSLGSDTNGSLRVPASLCGVFSLKPTYGRLSRGGTYPFVDSLDHLGPVTRTVGDLAAAYDAMQGPSPRDHAQAPRPAEPAAGRLAGGDKLRIGVLRGWFEAQPGADALERRDRVLDAFAAKSDITLKGVAAGRASAYIITNAESAAWHLPRQRRAAHDFDPDTRDRFLAGALLPAAWLAKAQRVRRWWLEELRGAFAAADVLVCPATPFSAPLIGQRTIEIAGREVLLRPNMGVLAQPFSAVGLPVVTVPVFRPGEAPIGIQLVAAPWREDVALAAAAHLATAGIAVAHAPAAPA
ncbi:MAG: AtzE family amidohydrolase [Acuticoccus sp.]